MACMISAICTGYKVRPRILVEEPIIHEPVSIHPDNLSYIQSCLTSVIKKGTGNTLKALDQFTIMGKSGTAQVRSRMGNHTRKEDYPHGYFAVHFRYKDEKYRTLVILLEHAGSSRHAIKLAHQFLLRYQSHRTTPSK